MQFISHRDNIRADELRQQAYESSLDSLGLKILDRRLRRDYAERSRKKKYNDTIRLNDQMKEEMIKQETRARVLKLESNELLLKQQILLKQQMEESMKKYNANMKKHKPQIGFVVSVDDVEEIGSIEMMRNHGGRMNGVSDGGSRLEEENDVDELILEKGGDHGDDDWFVDGDGYKSREYIVSNLNTEGKQDDSTDRRYLESAESTLLDADDLFEMDKL